MQIRKCPGCAGYLHFDAEPGARSCWNCGTFTVFARRENALQRGLARFDRFATSCLTRLDSVWRAPRIGRYALLCALPLAAFMLLICNSFDLHIVYDLTNSFAVR